MHTFTRGAALIVFLGAMIVLGTIAVAIVSPDCLGSC